MKSTGWLILFLLLAETLSAQFTVSGKVIFEGEPVPFATVWVEGTSMGNNGDQDGNFRIENVPAGKLVLKVSHVSYEPYEQEIELNSDLFLEITLEEPKDVTFCTEIIALRAGDNVPMTATTVEKEQLQKYNLGQDLPFLLRQTPSVVTTSDAGAGVGYTGIRVRGSDATRVNVTINGVPLNDSEGQGVYWVDLPDFASSVQNIQIQRGVGTSTNGAGAFGASLNVQTDQLSSEPYGELSSGMGSFNTWRNTFKAGTGLLGGKFAFNARLSRVTSDGFLDRAASNLTSLYLNGGYYGNKTTVKVNAMLGHERTYQSWYGTPESRVKGDIAGMNDYIANNYLDSADAANLLNSNSRTYNYYTYANEVDDYTQNHFQGIISHNFNGKLTANATLHYTRGKGYYEQFRKGEALADYGLEDVILGGDTVRNTDLIRRQWLDNYFYGVVYSLNYNSKKRLEASLGGAWNYYDGGHFGDIIWSQYASNSSIYDRYYENTGIKKDFNVYGRATYGLTDKIFLYGDLQLRQISYSFLGFDSNANQVDQQVNLTFFNPKAGLTYRLDQSKSLYASYAKGSREPSRQDYVQSSTTSRPRPEFLHDFELGYRHQGSKFSFSANLYYMLYKDQLVLTGQINDVGAYNRVNIPNSFRAGLEVDGGVDLLNNLRLFANATLSQNKISNFSEFIFDYDTYSEVENQLGNTDIAFSPNLIAGAGLIWKPVKGLDLTWFSKYVGSQYLDNTSSASRRLDAYFVSDLKVGYTFRVKGIREIGLNLLVNNILNEQYESNGYTYGWLAGGQRYDYNFLYPQAGINFLTGATVKF
ncbi:MAG: TonB-dependent receptor [Bacteroidia bacterium]|nr:TonB-dependent receptor [Bacteroidia bacterium]